MPCASACVVVNTAICLNEVMSTYHRTATNWFNNNGGAVAEWVRALAWNGDRTFPAEFEPNFGKNFSLRNFGNSVYPSLPVSFG